MPFLINVHDSDYQANNTLQATEHSLKNLESFMWKHIPSLYRIKQIITMFTQAGQLNLDHTYTSFVYY